MSFDNEKKKAILDNLSNRKYIVSPSRIEELSKNIFYKKFYFKGSNVGCGDALYFSVKKDINKNIEEILFSDEESCIIATSATNMICLWINIYKKNLFEINNLLENISKMVKGEPYNLQECRGLESFRNLRIFESRIECLNLVIRSFEEIIKK